MTLSQADADRLIDMIKKAVEESYSFPNEYKKLSFNVIGAKIADEFTINISRKGLNNKNCTCQGRIKRDNQILLRIDVGPTLRHTNPNELGGDKIKGDHIHIYKEGYDMNYAIPMGINGASFMDACSTFFSKFRIENPPAMVNQTEFSL